MARSTRSSRPTDVALLLIQKPHCVAGIRGGYPNWKTRRPDLLNRPSRGNYDFRNLFRPRGQRHNRTVVERRKSKRTKMVLPVKVSLSGTTYLAHTCDLNHRGARVGGLRSLLQPGETVCLQRGSKRANFKVVWIQQLDTNEVQVGLQAQDLRANFWGVDLPAHENDMKSKVDALMALFGKTS